MANNINLEIKVNAETGQLEVLGAKFEGLADKSGKAKDSFLGLKGEAGELAKSLIPFASAAGIAAFFTAAIKGAEEQAESMRRLKFVLESTDKAWDGNLQKIDQWTNSIQNATRFSGDEARSALERLTRVTGSLTQAQNASVLAMNLSVASGKSLQDTTALVIDLINRNDRALREVNREYGALALGATTTQGALDALSKTTANAAVNEQTLTKSVNQAANAWNDLSTQIGQTFTPVATFAFDILKNFVKVFDNFGTLVAAQVKIAITAFVQFTNILEAVFTFSPQKIKQAFNEAMQALKNDVVATSEVIVSTWQQADTRVVQSHSTRVETSKAKTQQEVDAEADAANRIVQLRTELEQKILSLGEQTYQKKVALLNSEVAARKAAINKEKIDEVSKQQLLAKLNEFQLKSTEALAKAEILIKTNAAIQIGDLAVQTLAILDSTNDKSTKSEITRAKAILALEKSIAIARAIAEAQKGGPFAAGIAAASIALIAAQFAQQSKAIDQAASAFRQSQAENKLLNNIPGIPGGGGLPSFGGGGSGGAVGASGGGPSLNFVITFQGDIIIKGVTGAEEIADNVVDIIGEKLIEKIKGLGQISFTGVS